MFRSQMQYQVSIFARDALRIKEGVANHFGVSWSIHNWPDKMNVNTIRALGSNDKFS